MEFLYRLAIRIGVFIGTMIISALIVHQVSKGKKRRR